MKMYEISHVRQVPGERRRRWFSSQEFDLVVTEDGSGQPRAFELYYDIYSAEQGGVLCREDGALLHCGVDASRGPGGSPATGMIVSRRTVFNAHHIIPRFLDRAAHLPPGIVAWVSEKLHRLASMSEVPHPAEESGRSSV